MGFEVHTTPYGEPAGELLAAQVRARKGGDPLAPVTVAGTTTVTGASGSPPLRARTWAASSSPAGSP